MISMFESELLNRISAELKAKATFTPHNNNIVSRGICEAIKLLEGLDVSNEAKAMKHKERELKGCLKGYFHIHVGEEHLTRAYNNISKDKTSLGKNPSANEVIDKATNAILTKYAKHNGITSEKKDSPSLTNAILASDKVKKNNIGSVLNEISNLITKEVNNIFSKPNSVTGDWLIYWKDARGLNYYIEHTTHIDPGNIQMQINTKRKLDKIRDKIIKK
ncbi:hypothetical protein SSARUM2_002119 [Serratia sp. K-E0102]|uniref:hypothetical protein n=1 Tax=Serratia TaxID=613 RepID=UPI0007454DCF|nr:MULTISPECIES: hypothetical protein [Serratia]WGZ69702.1 hypothetical protein SSARUM2_002119 [Serratia sp. K-E0102]CUZ47645.1 Uncharacterised protein [Serratia marcescens]